MFWRLLTVSIFLPTLAFAADPNISVDGLATALRTTSEFASLVAPKITMMFLGLFASLWIIYFCYMAIRFMLSGSFSMEHFLGAMLSLLFAGATLMYPDVLYGQIQGNLIKGTMSSLATNILNTGLSLGGGAVPGQGPITTSLNVFDEMFVNLTKILETYQSQSFFASLDILAQLQVLLMMVLFFAIEAAFIIMFVMGYVTVDILFVAAAPIVMFASLPWFRGLIKQWFKSVLTTALIPAFAAVALAITSVILNEVLTGAVNLVDAGGGLSQAIFWQLMLIMALSLFFHIKASTFAAMITGHNVTDFGQVFATGASLAVGALKTAANPVGAGAAAGLKAMGSAATQRVDDIRANFLNGGKK